MSQVEILAGRINALLDGAVFVWGMFPIGVGVVLYLLWLLAAIHAARDGDWTILLALMSWIGFPLVGFFLAPLVPYGTILGVVMTMLGFSVAWWLTRY